MQLLYSGDKQICWGAYMFHGQSKRGSACPGPVENHMQSVADGGCFLTFLDGAPPHLISALQLCDYL